MLPAAACRRSPPRGRSPSTARCPCQSSGDPCTSPPAQVAGAHGGRGFSAGPGVISSYPAP
eukprot:789711-Pleurochrysis_carterae.AAC.1